jgi:hypothetical protein
MEAYQDALRLFVVQIQNAGECLDADLTQLPH